MEIIVGKYAGFCFGVKRATRMAYETAEMGEGASSLGPIIHSPQVVSQLDGMGVTVVDSLDDVKTSTVIVRSHGVSSATLAEASRRGLRVVDATCPFVRKAQEHVADLSREGYVVVVVGDADHPEVQGIVSYAEGEVHVVASVDEARQLPRIRRVGIVAQTTQSDETFLSIVAHLVHRSSEARIFNTICDATKIRQEEAARLAADTDCVIVVGGYDSGNTRRLAQICSAIQPNTHHVESAADLDPLWFEGVGRVGVTAGASTPAWVIDEVVEALSRIGAEREKG